MDTRDPVGSIRILMLPWLAYGHVTPYLDLAKKLSLNNIKVYFCSTPINLRPIRENPLQLRDFPLIELVDLHLPTSVLPPHLHTTKNLPLHLNSTLKQVFAKGKPSFTDLLKALVPDLVVVDMYQPWAVEAANDMNIKSVMFFTSSASSIAFLAYYSMRPSSEFPLPFREGQPIDVDHFLDDEVIGGVTNRDMIVKTLQNSSKLVLIRTSKKIEPKEVEYLSALTNKEVVPIGTLIQTHARKDNNKHGTNEFSYVEKWLNQRDPRSVVYVSFGSEYFLSEEEMGEVARGLELSRANFIWVIRFPDGDDPQNKGMNIDEALPEGFLKRVEKRGLVLQGWAPQSMILGHPSTGGFVSHCGWSSTLEGIASGVPIIAMPVQYDQPNNAMLIEHIGVGLEVPRKDGIKIYYQKEKVGKIDGEEIAKVIHEVVKGERGKQVMERAMEYSRELQRIDSEFDFDGDKEISTIYYSLIS